MMKGAMMEQTQHVEDFSLFASMKDITMLEVVGCLVGTIVGYGVVLGLLLWVA